MSSHRRRVKHFSRKPTARKALLRSLMTALVEHGRISTTVDKAKELRRHIERAITAGRKDNGLATRRLLMSRVPNEKVVSAIVTDLAARFKDRNGGYTRIIKIGRRPGDQSEMAFIEFVDYDFNKSYNFGFVAEEKGAEKKAAKAPAKKATTSAVVAKKKSAKKTQKKSRQSARA